jgi:DNA-binding GntR family transcriptional regulator
MPDPMYRQIAAELRNNIEEGDFDTGQPLPTERERAPSSAGSTSRS